MSYIRRGDYEVRCERIKKMLRYDPELTERQIKERSGVCFARIRKLMEEVRLEDANKEA